MVYDNFSMLIGSTPMLRLKNIEREFGLDARIMAKLEFMNPAGSVKDRVARRMIESYKSRGLLNADSVIIEPTSGNTGIGLAAIAASMGLKMIIVMPDSMSLERQKTMLAYGAELVLTDGSLGMAGAIEKAEELHRSISGSIIAGQFTNMSNPEAHYLSTGPEIWQDTGGELACFVSGVGTGGTISGTGRYLKERSADICVAAVEPENSAVLSGRSSGRHDLQGIGAGFIPQVLDTGIYDRIVTVKDEEAYEAGRLLCRKEGLLVGISSGAALHAAIKLARTGEFDGKNIVVLLPDTGTRYLSTKMFED